MQVCSFEKLAAWLLSKNLTIYTYQLTKNFLAEERFGLTGQLRRAIVSVCSNIAEGTWRWSNKDKAHFYQLAFSSLMETLNQLILACELNFITQENLNECRGKIEIISTKLSNLRISALSQQG